MVRPASQKGATGKRSHKNRTGQKHTASSKRCHLSFQRSFDLIVPLRPATDVIRVVRTIWAYIWPGKLDQEYSCWRPRRIPKTLSLPRHDRHATPSVACGGQTAMPYCKNTTRWPPCPSAGWLCGFGSAGRRPLLGLLFFFPAVQPEPLSLLCRKVKYRQRATIFHLLLFLQKTNKPVIQNQPVIKKEWFVLK